MELVELTYNVGCVAIANSVLCSEMAFVDIVNEIRMTSTDNSDGPTNIVNVDRDNVLDGALRAFGRKGFDPTRSLNVHFVDEQGIDAGGLSKEFLRLTLTAIRDLPVFCGPANSRNILLDYNGLCQLMVSKLFYYIRQKTEHTR